MGRTSMGVKEELERNFPHLPFGCQIHLEEKAGEYIIENINSYVNSFRKDRIIQLIKNYNKYYELPLTLVNFVRLTKVPLGRLYKGNTWSKYCRLAGVSDVESKYEVELSRAVSKKWLSTDSFSYFSFIEDLANRRFAVDVTTLDEISKLNLLMLYYDLFDTSGQFESLQQMVDSFSTDSGFISEVLQIMGILKMGCEALELPDNSRLKGLFPLHLHGVYTKGQIQVALRTSTLQTKSSSREGAERQVICGRKVEAMYVDIIKDREEGSNTNYNDFAMTNELFHWETQNSVTPETKQGRNYINETQVMLLFVRKQQTSPEDKTRTMGYVYLGEVFLDRYSGSRPMQIVWRLQTPMPAAVCEYSCKYLDAI